MTSAYVLCETFPGKMQHIFISVSQMQTENNQSKLVESFSFIGVSYRTIGKDLLSRSQETQSHLLSYNVKQVFEKNYDYWILEAHHICKHIYRIKNMLSGWLSLPDTLLSIFFS